VNYENVRSPSSHQCTQREPDDILTLDGLSVDQNPVFAKPVYFWNHWSGGLSQADSREYKARN
jgi:hypothetical protein